MPELLSPDAVNEKLLKYRWIKRNDNDHRGFRNDELVFLTDGVVLMYPFRFDHYEIEAFSNIYTDDLCESTFMDSLPSTALVNISCD